MRFFTPELYIEFNSADDDVADRADREWGAAIENYRRHLDGLRDQIPAQVCKLAGLCLHDAELLAIEEPMGPAFPVPLHPLSLGIGFAILSVRQGGEIVSLIYALWDQVRKHASKVPWPFSSQRMHWLYDEVDVAPSLQGRFFHRVLLSDGTVIEIPFVSALIHRIPLPEGHHGEASKQIA
jgi:hypothetical protein